MSTARIMIVEDERITAESVKCTLEELGYAVCAIVSTGPDAVARAGTERPDLVLMDIVLRGDMDGIEAAEQIRSAYRIPIVYATAYADEPFLRRAKVTAPYGYILKPFTTRELHSNIEMALHKSQLDRRIARLNAVLDTIRRVNQLAIREHARNRLLQRVCELLTEHGGYVFAWVVVMDEAGKLLHTVHAGLRDEDVEPVVELLRRGERPNCIQRALADASSILVRRPELDCLECPLKDRHPNPQALMARIGHGGRSPGLLIAGTPGDTLIDDAERTLFGELAADISVALHAINTEAERSQTEQALRQAQKMEAVGQLAAGIAHDFNNFLTAVHGYLDLARRSIGPGHEARDYLRGIEVVAQHAGGVARSLLVFSGRSVARKETVNLPNLLRESSKLLRHVLPATVELQVDTSAEPALCVHADPTQLQQVFMNLAVNARDAMPTGGRLRIALSARDARRPGDELSSGAGQNATACISVSDTGAGMTPEVQERIFEPFFTTKARGEGTGLGLAIIQSIVREHGGQLEVESAPGSGATFRVLLPLVSSAVAQDTAVPDTLPASGRGEAVLVAEDDRHVREIVVAGLTTAGYAVTPVGDGAELWTRYLERRGAWHALILDIDLPKRDGADCLAAIRAGGDRVPAILITARSDIQAELLAAGELLLRKPFHVGALVRLVAQAIGGEELSKSAT